MKHQLKTVADIRAGYQFRGRVKGEPRGSHRLIQIRNFDEQRHLDVTDLVQVNPVRDPNPYLARPEDVLFLSRGHRLWAAHLADPPGNAIITGYFFIVRPRGHEVLPAYLSWYFNQTPFQNALRPFVRGSQMPLVSLADFGHLVIEIPSLKVQKTLVALAELALREKDLQVAIQTKRQHLINGICLQAVWRNSRGEGERNDE